MLSRTFCSAVLALVSLTSCHNPFGTGYSCPTDVTPAIVVEIRDARTGTPLANGAKGAVHDGAYVDSLSPYEGIGSEPNTLVSRRAADERPGTYAVRSESSWIPHMDYRRSASGCQDMRG